MIISEKIILDSRGNFYIINITEQVRDFVSRKGVKNGIVTLFYQHTTGSLLIFEQEAGVMVDLEDAFDRLFPEEIDYFHHKRAVDFNGPSHIRSAFLNPSLTIPIKDGDIVLGKYQEIVALDMQPDPKPRTLIIQVMGE
jgi:secondary thiamine-phosphate synthase enzyme